MKVANAMITLSFCLALACICGAEDKDIKATGPDTAVNQKAAPAESVTPPVKLSPAEAKKVVAARVNGTDIMLDQVTEMAALINARMSRGHDSLPNIEDVQKDALNRLVLQELAFQRAKKEGITVEQNAVDSNISQIKVRMGGDDAYKGALAAKGMTDGMFRAQVERDLMIEAIYKREVLDTISVPEEKMKEEYKKEKARFVQPEKMSLVDVVLFLDPSDKESAAKAEAIVKKIRENEADPHKLVPDGTFAVKDLDPKKDNDKELYEAGLKLKPGDISDVFKAGDTLHIIKLNEYVPEKQLAFADVRAAIENKLRTDMQHQKTSEWMAALKKDAKIEIILQPVAKQQK